MRTLLTPTLVSGLLGILAALLPAAPSVSAPPAHAAATQAAVAVRLEAPQAVRTGTRVLLTATVRPVRAGRPVRLEVRRAGRWRPVRTAEQRRARVVLPVRVGRTATFRAVAPRWRGAPAGASRPVTVVAQDPPRGATPWVTGYYAGWYWDQMYPPQQVDMAAMTHFVFGRVAPGAGSLGGRAGTLVPGAGTAHDEGLAPDGSGDSVEDYLVRRAHRAGGDALLMLGGDGLDGRGFVASTTDARRPAFVERIADYLVAHDYDGVDLDWENCLGGEDGCGASAATARRRLQLLIADLRTELSTRPRYSRTPALITFPGYAVNINFLRPGGKVEPWQADVARAVDQYNLMTYGVGTAWWGHGTGWHSWFSGALTGAGPDHPVDIASSVEAYVRTGVPASRIGIGIGFYGIYYGPEIDGPREYDADNDTFEFQDAALGYAELVRKGYLSHGTLEWDEAAQSTYRLYDGAGYVPAVDPDAAPAGMLSYEDERSIAAKGAWVRDRGVGGTILWTINYGYLPGAGSNPLLDATAEAFLDR